MIETHPAEPAPSLPQAGVVPGFDQTWNIQEIMNALMLDKAGQRNSVADRNGAGSAGGAGREARGVNAAAAANLQRTVSGRYRGRHNNFEIELRVDVDGQSPAMCVSGDLFKIAGATLTYHSSFIVRSASVSATTSQVQIDGTGSFSSATTFNKVRVTIPASSALGIPPQATVSFLDATNALGSSYPCDFESAFFRTIQYEHDHVEGRTPFSQYDTSLNPSGGMGRILSVAGSYAEAGIELQVTGVTPVVPKLESGSDAIWTNAELHAAMQSHFSLWKDEPQWKVWLFTATMHEMGSGLRGIMYDQQGKQRQGCAVFDDVVGGGDSKKLRGHLRTCVHELGHCFNLLHSWQKSLAVPPAPDRLDALSYMNYVQNFPGGESAYWAAFPFQFDADEVFHLRHGFRNHVIPGGSNFTIGAADIDPAFFADALVDNSGLELQIEARKSYAYSEPVVPEIKLYVTDTRGKRVHEKIHPNCGFVRIAIRKPSGQVLMYEPLMVHCFEGELMRLDQATPSIYDSAYLGYGRQGFYFDQVGFYQLRGVYFSADGSQVFSNTQTLRVRAPGNDEDEEVADLLLGDEQGQLFYLLGSDAESLANGNNAFEEVLAKHAKHPLAAYARLVLGVNAAREFKRIDPQKTKATRTAADALGADALEEFTAKEYSERRPDRARSAQLLGDLVSNAGAETGIAGTGKIDNITLGMAMKELATVQQLAGDNAAAQDTLEGMVETFGRMKLRPHVLRSIASQAKEIAESAGPTQRPATKKKPPKRVKRAR